MSSLTLTVHRSTQEIGGNCVEIADGEGHRVVLDVGRPLDAPSDAKGLLPKSLDLEAPCSSVLISHPHQDHYGLLEEAPEDWPVFSGEAAEKLLRLTLEMFGPPITRPFSHWRSGRRFDVGPFAVTPFLTDHSAFDSYMLLIEAKGRRILYSGDFRTHGRKGSLVERFMAAPPPDIDVLLMEGTNLGSDKPTMSEADLEEDFAALSRRTSGRVFVSWSAQNLDRTVTLYRACLKTGRTLVVDLYTAEVLTLLASHAKLPQPGWPNLKVVVTGAMARMYRREGREAFVESMVPHGISARRLAERAEQWIIMLRPSLTADYECAGAAPTPQDTWVWSMWAGYLKTEVSGRATAWFEKAGVAPTLLHTSGHASPADLRAFAEAIKPRMLVPIHGAAWDQEQSGFANVRRLADGEEFRV